MGVRSLIITGSLVAMLFLAVAVITVIFLVVLIEPFELFVEHDVEVE
jgi:hypothetical protein